MPPTPTQQKQLQQQQNPRPMPNITTSAPTLEEALNSMKARIDGFQTDTHATIAAMAEENRKKQEKNDAQFAAMAEENKKMQESIKEALAAIQAAMMPPSANSGPAGESTSADGEGEQPPPTASGAVCMRQASGLSFASTAGTESTSTSQAARNLHDLPKFSGSPHEWSKFISMYEQSTLAYGYTSLDNSIRLQRCLVGDAFEAVEFLLLETHNMDAVIDALEFRFGRPELVAQAQLRRVREIQPIPEHRPELIPSFASKVANMVAYLDKPKTQQYLCNPELIEQLVQKLPMSKRHQWGEHAVDISPFPTIRDLNEWLKKLARSVSFATPAATLAAVSHTTTMTTTRSRSSQQTNSNGRERMMHVSNAVQEECRMCDASGHFIEDCRRFAQLDIPDRWSMVRSKELCFCCLREGHIAAQCDEKKRCGVERCSRSHNAMLHSATPTTARRQNPFDRKQPSNTARENSAHSNESVLMAEEQNNAFSSEDEAQGVERAHHCQPVAAGHAQIMFRILPVKLYAENRTVETYALLDEGSSITMIDGTLASELQLCGPQTTLDVQWFGGRCASELSQTVALRISGIGEKKQRYYLGNVRTIGKLDLPAQSINMKELCERFDCLRGLPLNNYQDAVPKILIGVDNIHLSVATRQISCVPPGPVATRTRLGWVVCGPSQSSDANTEKSVLVCHQRDDQRAVMDELHNMVKEYFTIESMGVRRLEEPLESREDKRAKDILSRTTRRVGEQFETGLLWRRDDVRLPESKAMATNRLIGVERKMARDAVYAKQYVDVINDYIQKGYASLMTERDAACVTDRTWYLPHFGVTNPNKPGKIRVVFDAAASASGVSLNSELLKGPDLNQSLFAVLHQFRMGSIGVCADIKEMFLRVLIRKEDVNSQRFLWRNGDATRPIDVYVMNAMIFGAACSPCAAQYVKNTNADCFLDLHPTAVKMIKNAHYVDDFVASFETDEEAVIVTKSIVDIHSHAGFELRGFLSNSETVLRALGVSRTESEIDMQLAEAAEKILGMYWCTKEDAFLFRLTFNRVDPAVVNGTRRPTKRELLSATMSMYDPFGLLANFTIYAKLLLQDLWRHGTGWDEPVPEEVHVKWLQWVAKLECCRQVRVPRCYAPGISSKRVQLHVFADASQSAFAAVAYWRIETASSHWQLAFVSGKARCAPRKLMSIPRLELQAAVLAVRLSQSIRSMHDIAVERTFFWSDSKTVVQWIRSDRLQFRPFVAHRIAEILEETTVGDWRWVPTLHNAADDATRAKYPVRFEASNRWIEGPDFLSRAENEWPEEPATLLSDDGAEEVRPHSVQHVRMIQLTHMVQLTRFSNFDRLCRTTAYMLRFIRNARTKPRTIGELQPNELDEAEKHLVRAVQADAFAVELALLREGRPVEKSSPIWRLLPHIDANGILRVTGRLDKALHMPEDARNPVILPKKHRFTELVVERIHRRIRHQLDAAVVCEIRLRYWIPHVRVIVRRVRNDCMICRMKLARVIEPVMGQLPVERLTPYVRPFTYTGVDYFGPVHATIGRSRVKRWVALFTCMTTRAVHLELASDLSTDACILCVRNFVNLRGVPKRIRSDNGTNFVGASRELREAIDALDHAAFEREFSADRIEWVFNCPGNPEAGGCWERMVRCVKNVLSVTMKEVAPQIETLRSLLLEAANIVNSRPLTMLPVSSDADEPLTPNHFLIGSANSTQTPGSGEAHCLRKQWRIAQALKDRFWKMWISKYLPDLTRRAKGYVEHPKLVVGSLVLMCEPDLAHGKWRRGRVTEVFAGSDGRIRTASVQTSDGVYKRPVTKLAVLDVE